jgi:TetR/AcrR family transcriptional repressor of nem operon
MGAGADTRGRILGAALELFCGRGFAAVGTQEICARAGVLKGTLYHFFPTKTDLALAALTRYGDAVRGAIEAAARGRARPDRKLLRVFDASRRAAADQKAAHGMVCGCLHGNLALELAAADPRVRDHLEGITASWAAALAPVVEELVTAGTVPACDPPAAARMVLAYLHGAMLMAKTANDPDVVAAMGRSAVRLLGGADLVPGG